VSVLGERALRASFDALARCDLFMSVGTSSQVHPAAGFANNAREHNAIIADVNPDATTISSSVNIAVRAKSGEALPKLL